MFFMLFYVSSQVRLPAVPVFSSPLLSAAVPFPVPLLFLFRFELGVAPGDEVPPRWDGCLVRRIRCVERIRRVRLLLPTFRPALLPLVLAASTTRTRRAPLRHVRRVVNPQPKLLLLLAIAVDMLDVQGPPAHLCTGQVVDGQHGAPLVLVRNKPKALGLAGLLVSTKVDMHNLPHLRADRKEVALGERQREAAHVHVRAVSERVMPRASANFDPQLDLLPRRRVRRANLCQCI
mmetsp:Transcript_14249/g.40668  ORF Transcript_14249/g.40668 Transcript_14249/m.40668 type:complete len:234 (+) Transcript_14249:34-735(+)